MAPVKKLENDNFELEFVIDSAEREQFEALQSKYPSRNIYEKACVESPFHLLNQKMKENYFPIIYDAEEKRCVDKEEGLILLLWKHIDECECNYTVHMEGVPQFLNNLKQIKRDCGVYDYSQLLHRMARVWLEVEKVVQDGYLFLRNPDTEDLLRIKEVDGALHCLRCRVE